MLPSSAARAGGDRARRVRRAGNQPRVALRRRNRERDGPRKRLGACGPDEGCVRRNGQPANRNVRGELRRADFGGADCDGRGRNEIELGGSEGVRWPQ